MSADLKRRELELLKKKLAYKQVNKLEYYDPYPFQVEFHNDAKKRKGLRAGNQQGKCGTSCSLVDTENGVKSFGDIFGKDVNVLTYPNKEPRKVLSWVRKPAEECFRITMSDGQWFECPKGHRILTESGYLSAGDIFQSLPASVFSRQDFSLPRGFYQHVLCYLKGAQRGDRRLIRKVQDLKYCCLIYLRLNGAQLLSDKDNVQVFAPLQADARQHNHVSSYLGGLANKYIGNPLRAFCRLSSQGVDRQILGQFLASLFRASLAFVQYKTHYTENALLLNGFEYRQQPSDVKQPHQDQAIHPSLSPVSVNGNHIIAVKSVGVHTLYDMEVEERHNYIAAGMIHHNTVCGTADDAIHLTGLYPDWWTGEVYTRPIEVVCGSVNNAKTTQLLQKALMGKPVEKETSWGTGWIPKKCLDPKKFSLKRGVADAYETVMVKHHTNGVFDGWSTLTFSSYESGKAAWMGDTIDRYHGDEEPPMPILDQMARGCIASKGSITLTWTPENGSTEVVRKVAAEYSMHTAEWKDAAGEDFKYEADGEVIEFKKIKTIRGNTGHITREAVLTAAKDYTPRKMKMRMKGIPVVGVGLIFSQDESDIAYKGIEMQSHFYYLDALDFGGLSSTAHPTAFARLAWDKDADIIYVYDGFKIKGKEIPEIAARIVAMPSSQKIKCHWPHDGNKVIDKEGQTKTQYKKAGVRMFGTWATNPPTDGKGEGEGGIKRDPALNVMSQRFEYEKLKIKNTLGEFFEEYEQYHYDEKGEIVDEFDDFISAVRYGVMMIRHARPVTQGMNELPAMAEMY